MKKIIVNGIPVELERKRIRNLRLSVKVPDARVHVSVPWLMGEAAVREFVAGRMNWIQKQRTRILSMPGPEPFDASEAYVRLRPVLAERIPYWAEQFGETDFTWTIRLMKTRWGTCNYVKRKLTFNLFLARVPLECIDYVIVHELCHFLVPNHGPQFKALMTARFPSWPACRAELRNYTTTN